MASARQESTGRCSDGSSPFSGAAHPARLPDVAQFDPRLSGGWRRWGRRDRRSVTTWYPTLKKPSFTPPSWVFGPVWTTLYLLMGVSLYLIRTRGTAAGAPGVAGKLFMLQLLLNALWSFIFFGLRSPGWALVEIVGLWAALMLTIRAVARVSRPAAVLLVPYLLWTSFALVLNAAIWRLNAGA